MKATFYFILLILICLANTVHSQYLTYKMKDEGNMWSVFRYSAENLGVIYGNTYHIIIQGYTVLEEMAYEKLYQWIPEYNQTGNLIGFLREDWLERKVWMRTLDDREGLMYDFSVAKGDSVHVYNPFEKFTYTFIVNEVRSENFNGHDYKIWIFTNSLDYWIEEIGSESGLIYLMPGMCGGGSRLTCYTGRYVNYVNPRYNTCEPDTAVIELTTGSLDTAIIHQAYEFQFESTDSTGSHHAAYHDCSGHMPEGLSLVAKTGVLSGVPEESGSSRLTICVSNQWFWTDCREYYLYVDPGAEATDETALSHSILYPNPVVHILKVDPCMLQTPCNFEIIDLLGIVRAKGRIEGSQVTEIDVGGLKTGIYYLKTGKSSPELFIRN